MCISVPHCWSVLVDHVVEGELLGELFGVFPVPIKDNQRHPLQAAIHC